MKKTINCFSSQKLFWIFCILFVFTIPSFAQSMSDEQVMEYVKININQGKDQRQIISELARRGVTQEQAMRVKKKYEKDFAGSDKSTLKADTTMSRTRQKNEVKSLEDNFDFTTTPNEINTVPQPDAVMYYTFDVDSITGEEIYKRNFNPEDQIFGRNIFNTKNLTFEPSTNLATPPTYRLGPGDEVIIDIWGTNQNSIRQTISPDGYINIEDLGLVYLNGMTVAGATEYLRKELNKIYTGIDGAQPSSEIKLTLGNSRTIQINVMGEVVQPGTYALSSFATVFHALYSAGGVSNIGSLRSIQVVRDGKKIADVDVYKFIMEGKTNDDVRLQEGDVIIVSPYDALVQIKGNVKRPMKYEMRKDEPIETLLKYAGGFTGDAYTKSLRMIRQNGREYQIETIFDKEYPLFAVQNGDVVTADPIINRFTNKLEIKGAVYRPGIYQLGDKISTVRELVQSADGLMGDAFTARAVLMRERENLTREVVAVNIKDIMDGKCEDITLKPNDMLYIPSIHDLEDLGTIKLSGEIARPGSFPYADNMTLEDLIIQGGGLKEAASTVRVDVSRRIKDPKNTESTATVGELFSFSLKDGFIIDGQPGFVLQPYDQVYVRRSPSYQEQMEVKALGEILYPGKYSITNKNERISELIRKAGGVTPYAYVEGARLLRKANDEEMKRMEQVIKLMQREMGETSLDSLKLEIDSTYSVGINLAEALAKPGSTSDIVLREGDRINVPEMVNTVSINGAVMLPNTISFQNKKPLKYYINQAGGFANGARKSKAFIIYMNGQVAKVKGSGKGQIQPGCEIVIPVKDRNRQGVWNFQTILNMASSLGSLGLTAASIANILK